jgi:hypothetical protein
MQREEGRELGHGKHGRHGWELDFMPLPCSSVSPYLLRLPLLPFASPRLGDFALNELLYGQTRQPPEPSLLPPCVRIRQLCQRMLRSGEDEQVVPDGVIPPIPFDQKAFLPMFPMTLHRAIRKAAADEVAGRLVDQVQNPRRQHQPTAKRPGPKNISHHRPFFNRHPSRTRLHHARRHHLPVLNCLTSPAEDFATLSEQHSLMVPIEALRHRLSLPLIASTPDRRIRKRCVLQGQQISLYLLLRWPAKCEHRDSTAGKKRRVGHTEARRHRGRGERYQKVKPSGITAFNIGLLGFSISHLLGSSSTSVPSCLCVRFVRLIILRLVLALIGLFVFDGPTTSHPPPPPP